MKRMRRFKVDRQTAQWLRAKADATHKTPAEIIGELVREKAECPPQKPLTA